jgi:Mg-chelatase subunit ChlD
VWSDASPGPRKSVELFTTFERRHPAMQGISMRNLKVLGFGVVVLALASGCGKGANGPTAKSPAAPSTADGDASLPVASAKPIDGKEPADTRRNTTWIGASAEGEMLMSNTRDTVLGVWVDVPEVRPEVRPPMEVALVVDTSGSMAGAKIENARAAASTLVRNLKDGDIVALDAFSDNARTVVPPTRLNAESRQQILRAISGLTPAGSTNMFEGLTLAEGQVAAAPPSHAIRRVVVISDGIANVGPSSPETLGAIAERGLRFRAQVTSLGVGNDYDERTLNALSVKSSGRLYHLTEPKEMATILKGELDLLDATLASDSSTRPSRATPSSKSFPPPESSSSARTASAPTGTSKAPSGSRSAPCMRASTARRSSGFASPIRPPSRATRDPSRASASGFATRRTATSSASRRSSPGPSSRATAPRSRAR